MFSTSAWDLRILSASTCFLRPSQEYNEWSIYCDLISVNVIGRIETTAVSHSA